MSYRIVGLPAFQDNYIWMVIHPKNQHAIVVDPGESAIVLETLQREGLTLEAILVTHHHYDHTAGIAEIIKAFPVPVYGPKEDNIPTVDHKMNRNDTLKLPKMELSFQAISIPAHTLGHIAFYGNGWLFCGDTLFSGGCGRLFEGTAAQMFQSLQRLAALPKSTEVYCGHEYTLDNIKFALTVEPNNQETIKYQNYVISRRNKNLPSLPSTIEQELKINPFLRCNCSEIRQSIATHFRSKYDQNEAVFTHLRKWKDSWSATP